MYIQQLQRQRLGKCDTERKRKFLASTTIGIAAFFASYLQEPVPGTFRQTLKKNTAKKWEGKFVMKFWPKSFSEFERDE